MEFHNLLSKMVKARASDLFIKVGSPPSMRIDGRIRFLQDEPTTPETAKKILHMITKARGYNLSEYLDSGGHLRREIDIAYDLRKVGRFRCNISSQRGQLFFVLRTVSRAIMTFEDLKLPREQLIKLASITRGMVLVTGVTGSGKSSTLATMVNYINHHMNKHIITIEDPIEYVFKDKRSIITQREIGQDTASFPDAIRAAMRQAPDVLMIGEMRDQETFEFGLTAAETGHLVFGTLHAGTVSQSIGRILGLFPPDKHHVLRQGLQFNLRSIICQKLVPSPVRGRQPINEILIASPIVKKILAEGADKKLNAVMMGGREDGMMTFDQCLLGHCKAGVIEVDMALKYATNPDQFKLRVQGIELGGSSGGIIG